MNTQNHFKVNFSLQGFASVQIGIYFMLAGYLIKNILDGFLIDDNTMGMLSAEIIEVLLIVIAVLTFMFSSLAIYFKSRRRSKKLNDTLWNPKTKTTFWIYILSSLLIFLILIFLMNQGFIDYIAPVFLILYAILVFVLRNKDNKSILIISSICLLLATLCFLIPSYWYSSLIILGLTHITFGIVKKTDSIA
ncbi:hypothetical protein K8354_11860 [Polaribacter litorisediminis]|uniref:hypothetical protein n=1 Tax=Polaribacter litorisediminis TaxID=1908341 RepID=UPI001CBFBC0B|nr:hypothetical protein [Polaribacter litorisediminis]UAM97016.1 hypothetical protein K8354_11860 [Polaribacter litorisediminis]